MTALINQKQIDGAKLYSTRYEFIKTLPKKISCVEAGVLAGDFALKILDSVGPSVLHLIDPFEDLDYFANEYGGARWDYKEEHYKFVSNRFKKNTFDFIYIDYEHTYSATREALWLSTNIVSEGGIVGFNDYNIYENNTKNGEKMGTVPAINDFLFRNPEWHVYAFAFNDNLTSDIYLKRS
jgi:hypothetical protein